MLLLFILNLFLLISCSSLGGLVFKHKSRFQNNFYTYTSCLVGLLGFCFLSQVWALFLPVNYIFLLLIIIFFVRGFKNINKDYLIALTSSALIAAIFCSIKMDYGDSGLYHGQLMLIKAQYGKIPGIANLIVQYGYPSSWFSLFAVFFNLPFKENLLQLPSSVVLNLLLMPAFLIILSKEKTKKIDLFLAISLLFISFMLANDPMIPSSNADLAIMLYIPFITWLIYKIGFKPIIVPLIAIITSIKLHALSLFACYFLLLSIRKKSLKKLTLSLVYFGLFLIPSSLESIYSSGYLLLPLKLPKLNLAWTNNKIDLSETSQSISEYARFGQHPDSSTPSYAWIFTWHEREPLFAKLLIISFLLSIFSKRNYFIYIFGLGMSLIILLIIPSYRYALGPLAIIPAFYLKNYINKLFLIFSLLLVVYQYFLGYLKNSTSLLYYKEANFHKSILAINKARDYQKSKPLEASYLLYFACQNGLKDACKDLLLKQADFDEEMWLTFNENIKEAQLISFLKKEVDYKELPLSTLLLPYSTTKDTNKAKQYQFQNQLISTFIGDFEAGIYSYCFLAPPPCAKANVMGNWTFIDKQAGIKGGIKPLNLNNFQEELSYLRPYMAKGDFLNMQIALNEKCQSGSDLACALAIRFENIVEVEAKRTKKHLVPKDLEECKTLLKTQGSAAWRCAYEAYKVDLEGADQLLEQIALSLDINGLLGAPNCIRTEGADCSLE